MFNNLLAVEEEGDRAVVDEVHAHAGAEDAGLGVWDVLFDCGDELFVERCGDGGRGSLDEPRP